MTVLSNGTMTHCQAIEQSASPMMFHHNRHTVQRTSCALFPSISRSLALCQVVEVIVAVVVIAVVVIIVVVGIVMIVAVVIVVVIVIFAIGRLH